MQPSVAPVTADDAYIYPPLFFTALDDSIEYTDCVTRVESAILTEAYVQIVTGECAVDQGSSLGWGQLTVPCL